MISLLDLRSTLTSKYVWKCSDRACNAIRSVAISKVESTTCTTRNNETEHYLHCSPKWANWKVTETSDTNREIIFRANQCGDGWSPKKSPHNSFVTNLNQPRASLKEHNVLGTVFSYLNDLNLLSIRLI